MRKYISKDPRYIIRSCYSRKRGGVCIYTVRSRERGEKGSNCSKFADAKMKRKIPLLLPWVRSSLLVLLSRISRVRGEIFALRFIIHAAGGGPARCARHSYLTFMSPSSLASVKGGKGLSRSFSYFPRALYAKTVELTVVEASSLSLVAEDSLPISADLRIDDVMVSLRDARLHRETHARAARFARHILCRIIAFELPQRE